MPVTRTKQTQAEINVVLAELMAIRDALNYSGLKVTEPDFYYKVKDFCCDVINEKRYHANHKVRRRR